MKETVVVLFGGKSVEHDISIITAVQAMKNLPKVYDVVAVYVDKDGNWWTGENFQDAKVFENFEKLAKNKRQVTFVLGSNLLLIAKGKKFVPLKNVDVVLNCCHGNLGEDGSAQGLFKVCGIAQTSPQVLSSALCMDKVLMKDILKANDILTPEYVYLKKDDLKDENCYKKILKKLSFPIVVKPSNLGSSIGIGVAKDKKSLQEAVEVAFEFDGKVVCEKMVKNLREFNCACFNFQGKKFLSMVNEVQNKSEIFSFDDKYLSKKSKTKEPDKKLASQIKALTQEVYNLFECRGVVRVDFLYDDQEEKLYVNEINTIPGSLAFYLFKDIKFEDLLASLIEQAKIDQEQDEAYVKTFESDALKIFNKEMKMLKK